MRYASYQSSLSSGKTSYGVVLQNGIVDIPLLWAYAVPQTIAPSSLIDFISNQLNVVLLKINWESWQERDLVNLCTIPLSSIKLTAPIPLPRRHVVCVGLNYLDHLADHNRSYPGTVRRPVRPVFFAKPNTAVIGPFESIAWDPEITLQLDYEIELAVVIGKSGRNIPKQKAFEHIFGYSLINDISARDVQAQTPQFYQAKGMDTYCPFGPVIVDIEDIPNPHKLTLSLFVNGELRQHQTTQAMLFDIPSIIASLSQGMSLWPGDVIATGTPGGCGYTQHPPIFLEDGDRVTCYIEQIGTLENTIEKVSGRYSV